MAVELTQAELSLMFLRARNERDTEWLRKNNEGMKEQLAKQTEVKQ